MANEITFRRVAGDDYAITIRNIEDSLKIWKPSATVAFEAFGTGARTLADYGINAAETFSNGMFSVDMPAEINTAHRLLIEIYKRAGANLADDDDFDGSFVIIWNGSAVVYEIDTNYDPPTRVEATTDRDAILAKLPAALSGGFIKSDVQKVNGETPVSLSDMSTGARNAILDDATRFSGADIAAILTDTDELITDNIPARIAAIVGDIFDRVGITEGGSWDLTKALTILNAWIAGNWRVKSGESGTQELLDADNGTTVILEMVLSRTSPYRSITVKI